MNVFKGGLSVDYKVDTDQKKGINHNCKRTSSFLNRRATNNSTYTVDHTEELIKKLKDLEVPLFPKTFFQLPFVENLNERNQYVQLKKSRMDAISAKNHIAHQMNQQDGVLDSEIFGSLRGPSFWAQIAEHGSIKRLVGDQIFKRVYTEAMEAIDQYVNLIDSKCAEVKDHFSGGLDAFDCLSEVEKSIVIKLLDRSSPANQDYPRERSRRIQRGRATTPIGDLVHELLGIYPETELQEAFRPESRLISEDYIEVELKDLTESGWDQVGVALNEEKLFPPKNAPETIARERLRFTELKAPNHTFDDLYIEPRLLTEILSCLTAYKKGRLKNASFLFYGTSGAGKTSLADAISHHLGYELLHVRDYVPKQESLPYVVHFLKQKYKKRKIVMLFDECESLWGGDSFFSFFGGAPKENAWSKHLLEQMPGVVIYTSNYAPPTPYLRRVLVSAELLQPSVEARKMILQKALKKICLESGLQHQISEEQLEKLAYHYELTGGFVERAMRLATGYATDIITYDDLNEGLSSVARSLGSTDKTASAKVKDLVLSEDQSKALETISKSLKLKSQKNHDALMPNSTSILLYGPPGTGKTEFAMEVGRVLKKPVSCFTASDFLSMWVGQTEKTIAKIFRKAEKNNEIIFIDEVESLFRSRDATATSRHDLSSVGEFLKQIENFNGVLIVATNHKELLDTAFSRRFLFHLEFKLPSFADRVKMLRRFVGESVSLEQLKKIAQNLEFTPGEVRNAVAIWNLQEHQTARDLEIQLQHQVSIRKFQRDRVIQI